MRTAPVQIVCRKCSTPYRTSVRGGSSRCPHCRASRYVRTRQQWEGPTGSMSAAAERAAEVAARAAVWCRCPRCEHRWQSRARDHVTVRCPDCRHAVRVPRRRWENTGAVPDRVRYVPAPEPEPEPVDVDPVEPEPEPVPLTGWATAGLWGGLLPRLTPPEPAQTPVPAPARPAAPARPPAPRPAAEAPPTARRADPETRRRDSICSLVRSLGGPVLVWYDAPAGRCEAMDTRLPRERQVCPADASRRVIYGSAMHGQVSAYACPTHARDLADAAAPHPAVDVVVYMTR